MLLFSKRKLISITLLASLLVFSGFAFGQSLEENLIRDMKWRNIGPANMSGRISDIEAVESDFTKVFVASASGGVWKSVNGGNTFEPIFDKYGSASIGDIAIHQKNPDIIWVGTGEKNPRNSIAWGDGIYKSTDGGATFEHMGLRDTHSISKVIIHPDNPNVVFAGAGGHLWGLSGDRGLFKTTDGGKTWNKLTNGLPDDGKTGVIDMVMDPKNPDVMYVGFWQRLRQPHRFDSGGPNGGIFKTTNGGRSWTKLTNGLPPGDTGKIGLAVSRSNPRVLMAFVEHSFQPRQNDADYSDMSKLGTGIYRSENGGSSWKYMNRFNNRPFYYSHIYINPVNDKKIYALTSRMYESEDGGKTLTQTGGGIHVDFHALWLDPNNEDRYWVGSDGGVALTHDHKNYFFFDNYVISQFYAAGVDMRDPYYVYGGLQDNGTWGGPSRSRDNRGILTDHWYNVGGGDGFHAQVDPTDWRTVYVESQQGRISRRNVETGESTRIVPNRNNIINYNDYITEDIEREQRSKGWNNAFRFNWSSPIILSPHNPRTIYFGGNHVFKSVNRGDSWSIISPDLSKNDPERTQRETGGMTRDVTGAENHGSIITISESPIKAGLLWVGTDDGNVQISRDGGVTWKNIRSGVPGVPHDLWVSRVEASHFEVGTAYLTFDGHRSDNFTPWVFKTTDYGESWTNIANNIPDGQVVYVIKEDLKNPDLLFVGTEFAVFYSITGGQSWTKLNQNMPTVAVHDLVIHPRDGDLIAATHGRGIWIMDDITPLQQATKEVITSESHLFMNRVATRWQNISRGGSRGQFLFEAENPTDDAVINFYIGDENIGNVTMQISDLTGKMTRNYTIAAKQGVNRLEWNMRFDPDPQAIDNFISQIKRNLDRLAENAEGDQAEQVEEIREMLADAGTDPQDLASIQQQMFRTFGAAAFGGRRGGRRGGRGGGLQGPPAQPGEYLVKMMVNGETHTGKIVVREDPLLSKNR